MLESVLETKVIKYAKSKKCICYKFVSPGRRGVPDRIIIAPSGKVGFIELKQKGCKPSVMQQLEISRINSTGVPVIWTSNERAAVAFIDALIKLDGL